MNPLKSSIGNFRNLARAAKKSMYSTVAPKGFRIDLNGRVFRVAYESRVRHADRDYEFLQHLARGARVVLDIGGNVGLTSMLMATESEGQVYLFEASEAACVLAKENIGKNGLGSRIRVVNALVASKPGEVIEFFWATHSGGASIMEGWLGHDFGIFKASISIDDFCAQKQLSPDVLKIDVEGAESHVLRGCERVLREHRPRVGLELHGWEKMTLVDNAAAILKHVRELGYKMIYLRTRQAVNDAKELEGRGRCHVLLLPEEVPPPAWLSSLHPSL